MKGAWRETIGYQAPYLLTAPHPSTLLCLICICLEVLCLEPLMFNSSIFRDRFLTTVYMIFDTIPLFWVPFLLPKYCGTWNFTFMSFSIVLLGWLTCFLLLSPSVSTFYPLGSVSYHCSLSPNLKYYGTGLEMLKPEFAFYFFSFLFWNNSREGRKQKQL